MEWDFEQRHGNLGDDNHHEGENEEDGDTGGRVDVDCFRREVMLGNSTVQFHGVHLAGSRVAGIVFLASEHDEGDRSASTFLRWQHVVNAGKRKVINWKKHLSSTSHPPFPRTASTWQNEADGPLSTAEYASSALRPQTSWGTQVRTFRWPECAR